MTQGVLGPQYIGKVLPYMLSSSAVTALVSKTLASLRSNNPVACITAIHGGLEAMFSEEVSRPKVSLNDQLSVVFSIFFKVEALVVWMYLRRVVRFGVCSPV